MQSLRYFASGIWLAISIGPKYSDGGTTLLLALFYLSRLLSFIGFVCCASLLGVTTIRDRLIFCAIVCFTVLLGRQQLCRAWRSVRATVHPFRGSPNGTTLLAIYFAIRGRFTAALFWTGATFFINAFNGSLAGAGSAGDRDHAAPGKQNYVLHPGPTDDPRRRNRRWCSRHRS